MLKIGDKTFLNIQEAVGWLMANNALPFQCKAKYVADTEIAKTSIINPSPAEIKVGSLVLFADSKVGTVSGITTNGFMVSSEYTDIQSALVYISNVSINDLGHLITSLSDGSTKDAGPIKMISSFSIDASQHLIAVFNDGTSQDLGAIFQGNVNISGNLTANSIVENMTGYSFTELDPADLSLETVYAGAVKNGNKVTFVFCMNITATNNISAGNRALCSFDMPLAVGNKLNTTTIGGITVLDISQALLVPSNDYTAGQVATCYCNKTGPATITLGIRIPAMTAGEKFFVRREITFLLSNNFAQ